MKKFIFFLSLILNCLIISFVFSQQETVTIATYYPAPSGDYNDLFIHQRMAIGDLNNDNQVNDQDLAHDENGNLVNGSLTVANSVGIGTNVPHAMLDINGSLRIGSADDGACGDTVDNDVGLLRRSTTTNLMEYCDGSVWQSLQFGLSTVFEAQTTIPTPGFKMYSGSSTHTNFTKWHEITGWSITTPIAGDDAVVKCCSTCSSGGCVRVDLNTTGRGRGLYVVEWSADVSIDNADETYLALENRSRKSGATSFWTVSSDQASQETPDDDSRDKNFELVTVGNSAMVPFSQSHYLFNVRAKNSAKNSKLEAAIPAASIKISKLISF